jgi:hypothetical protein
MVQFGHLCLRKTFSKQRYLLVISSHDVLSTLLSAPSMQCQSHDLPFKYALSALLTRCCLERLMHSCGLSHANRGIENNINGNIVCRMGGCRTKAEPKKKLCLFHNSLNQLKTQISRAEARGDTQMARDLRAKRDALKKSLNPQVEAAVPRQLAKRPKKSQPPQQKKVLKVALSTKLSNEVFNRCPDKKEAMANALGSPPYQQFVATRVRSTSEFRYSVLKCTHPECPCERYVAEIKADGKLEYAVTENGKHLKIQGVEHLPVDRLRYCWSGDQLALLNQKYEQQTRDCYRFNAST